MIMMMMMMMMMTALVFVSGFTLGLLLNEMKNSRLSRPCILNYWFTQQVDNSSNGQQSELHLNAIPVPTQSGSVSRPP